jgi:hypothetical protein
VSVALKLSTPQMVFTPSCKQMLLAVVAGISRCRGTLLLLSLAGFHQIEWLPPSRSSSQPSRRRCRSRSRRLIMRLGAVA